MALLLLSTNVKRLSGLLNAKKNLAGTIPLITIPWVPFGGPASRAPLQDPGQGRHLVNLEGRADPGLPGFLVLYQGGVNILYLILI